MNTLPQTARHLDETPVANWLFANITATKPSEIKAVATTITRGTTLLDSGYAFVRSGKGRYIVANENGDTYDVRFDAGQKVASCSCDGFAHRGICKHVVCLSLNKRAVDLDSDIREARAVVAAKPAAASYADRWDAFWNEVDAKQAN